MYLVMTICAQRNQVLLTIVSLTTPETSVMNLKIDLRTTNLAGPTIALQHTLAEFLVWFQVEPHTSLFRNGAIHDAFSGR